MFDKKKSPGGGETIQGKSQKQATDNIAETKPKNKGESQKKSDAKSREWWCVVYPESAPDNWMELVQETFLEAYISPLHDQDLLPDGTPKKAHYHVVLAWPGPTTFSNAKSIMQDFGGIIQPKVIGSLRGVCRYLCHLDNPDKAQYSQGDVVCYNGADYELVINLKSDKYVAIEEMQAWCDRYHIYSFQTLNTYARLNRKADWFRCLCDGGAYIMKEYCQTIQWHIDHGLAIPTIEEIEERMALVDSGVNPETGELISPLSEGVSWVGADE